MKNIPNQLTISRIVLIFVFVLLANFDSTNPTCIQVAPETAQVCHVVALIIAFIAGITDLLDGYLARKYHWESDFGRLMDPLADKIFMVATFCMLLDYDMIPGWILILILAREFMVTGLRTLATAKGVIIAADGWGKLKTALQMFTLACAGLSWVHVSSAFDKFVPETGFWSFLRPMAEFSVTQGWFVPVWNGLLYFITFVTVFSGLGYFIKHRKLYMGALE